MRHVGHDQQPGDLRLEEAAVVGIQFTPDTQAPSAPTNLTATATSTSSISLSWTASTDNVGVARYQIFRNDSASSIGLATGTTFTNTGLSPSTTYTYSVVAYDASNNQSDPSNQASATTSLLLTKLNQTITFGSLANRALAQSPFTVSATASSGLPVTFSTITPSVCTSSGTYGEIITLVTTGTCTVRASQAGDALYNAATPVNRNFNVTA